MSGGKLSPRQKMINMMYLVLMALLALNVSKEILKSFFFFEQSFNAAAVNIESKNNATMGAFAKSMETNQAKTKPYFDRAQNVQKEAAEFYSYIDGLKAEIEKMYDGRESGANSPLKAPDQMEKHAKYFTENNNKKGKELMDKINNTRESLLAYLKPGNDSVKIRSLDLYNQAKAACQLNAEDEKGGVNKAGWINEMLEHQPAAGLIANLARIKNDAKTLESDILERLAKQIDATDYKFDKLEAKVLAKSNYVMEGENYEADILLVASNSKGTPDIRVGGSSINTEGGVGKYSTRASGVGIKTFSGSIVVTGPDGEAKPYPFEAEYQVFKPAATIAATEMNLLYKGIDNPMSISVPGFSAADVKISAPGINLTSQGGGLYNAKVPSSTNGEVTISASVTMDGKTRTVGSQKFRVRSLPQPTAQLGGIPNDGLPKGKASVAAQTSLLATMGAGFAYNLNYRVTDFKLIIAYARKPPVMASGSGSALTGQMRSMISSAGPGDRILIEGIRASEAKYGFTANLSPIIITIR
ncbi:MAG: gliding motility protein GldM [Bacteroidota bacterium]|jgi:gliding motility-associated protein GldM